MTRIVIPILAALLVSGCATRTQEIEELPSESQLTANRRTIAPREPIVFVLSGSPITNNHDKIYVFVNGNRIPRDRIEVSGSGISILPPFDEGKNVIEIITEDIEGKIIDQTFEILVEPAPSPIPQTPEPTEAPSPTEEPGPTASPEPSEPTPQFAIESAELIDIDQIQSPLEHFSISPHPYFDQKTPINGTLSFSGLPGSYIKGAVLEILQQGQVLAQADLTESARAGLESPINDSGRLELPPSGHIFDFEPHKFDIDNLALARSVNLRIRAVSDTLEETTYDVPGEFPILVRYSEFNRYPVCSDFSCRDPKEGGDDWVLPRFIPALTSYRDSFDIGDISNLHGGYFIGHASHRKGNDVDGFFPGYNNRDTRAAREIIRILDHPEYGRLVRLVFVTFTPEFGGIIASAILANGRRASDVVLDLKGHKGHFHLRMSAE